MEAKIRDYGKQWGLTPDTKGASKHWSEEKGFAWVTNLKDHPLDGDASTDVMRKSQYAVDYYQTSSYIHCYSTALDNFWPGRMRAVLCPGTYQTASVSEGSTYRFGLYP
jgi:hypothetical protein